MTAFCQDFDKAGPTRRAAACHSAANATGYAAVPGLQAKRPEKGNRQVNALAQLVRSDEENLQKKLIRQAMVQKKADPTASVVNGIGVEGKLTTGMKHLSSVAPGKVESPHHSSHPKRLRSLAYANDTHVQITSGQGEWLPREAWHVLQQKPGGMRPSVQTTNLNNNGNNGLATETNATVIPLSRNFSKKGGPATFRPSQKNIIQKVSVEVINPVNNISGTSQSPLSPGIIQMVSVEVARPCPADSTVSEQLLLTAIVTMKQIVEDAEKAEGKANSQEEHKRLTGILEDEDVKKKLPGSANSTYGLGGSNYFGNTPFTTTQGPSQFGEVVSAVDGIGATKHLGARKTAVHDEIHQISAYPGLQALASSQEHCFFCYGTIDARGYQHGALRKAEPWPQDWQHDYLGFKLKKTSKEMISIEYASYPVIKITSDRHGVRYYFVTKA